MGSRKSLHIAAASLGAILCSTACLSAHASIPLATTVVTPHTTAPAPTVKAPVVTASTPQFSCPNCNSTTAAPGMASQVNLSQTIGQTQASTTAVLHLGAGALVPQHFVNYPVPLTSNSPPVTYVTADQAAAAQAASMVSATFDGGGLFNDNGDLDKEKLGEFMVENAGISEEYAKQYYGEDSVGKVLKTESYTSPFTADNAIEKGDDS